LGENAGKFPKVGFWWVPQKSDVDEITGLEAKPLRKQAICVSD
jgi:hypothetical protein